MSGPCGACANWTTEGMDATEKEGGSPNLLAGGWGRCLEMRVGKWKYQSRNAACAFEPVRFVTVIVRAPGLPEEIDFG